MQTGTLTTTEGPRYSATLKTGAMTVTMAGTAVAIGSATDVREVLIQAKRTNSGQIYVGPVGVLNDNTNGVCLEKTDFVKFYCTTLADIYINATVSKEGVTFLYW